MTRCKTLTQSSPKIFKSACPSSYLSPWSSYVQWDDCFVLCKFCGIYSFLMPRHDFDVCFFFIHCPTFFKPYNTSACLKWVCNEFFRLLLCFRKTCCIVQENITLLFTLMQTVLKFIKCISIFLRESESSCV